MRKFTTVFICAAAVCAGSASAGEKVDQELAKLRAEVTALRKDVAKLVAQKDERGSSLKKLLEIAKKLKAGEELKDGSDELATIKKCLSMTGAVASRAMGLMGKLTKAQRCRLLAGVTKDVTVYRSIREAAMAELVAIGGEEAREAIKVAIEQERLLPAGDALGHAGTYYDARPRLAIAAGDLKSKVAVEFSIECLESTAKRARSALAKKKAGPRYGYAPGLWGSSRTLVTRLKGWSGLAEFDQFLERQGGRRHYYRFDTEEKAKALEDALAKTREWWKANKEKFDFPEVIAPVEPERAPVRQPRNPVERF